MTTLDRATVDHLLTTTRAVRKRLDLESTGRARGDRGVPAPRDPGADRRQLAGLALDRRHRSRQARSRSPTCTARSGGRTSRRAATPRPNADAQQQRVDGLGDVPRGPSARGAGARDPVHLRRGSGAASSSTSAGLFGSIYPAVWSFQLALRSRGLGSAFTTLHLPFAARGRRAARHPRRRGPDRAHPGRVLHRRRLPARGAPPGRGDHLLERLEAAAR